MDAPPLTRTDAFAQVPDPRGRRHPLAAALNLLAVALLAGMKSLGAVAQFGRDHGAPLARALGFRPRRTPCEATLPDLPRRLDAAAERAVADWRAARCLARPLGCEKERDAIDEILIDAAKIPNRLEQALKSFVRDAVIVGDTDARRGHLKSLFDGQEGEP